MFRILVCGVSALPTKGRRVANSLFRLFTTVRHAKRRYAPTPTSSPPFSNTKRAIHHHGVRVEMRGICLATLPPHFDRWFRLNIKTWRDKWRAAVSAQWHVFPQGPVQVDPEIKQYIYIYMCNAPRRVYLIGYNRTRKLLRRHVEHRPTKIIKMVLSSMIVVDCCCSEVTITLLLKYYYNIISYSEMSSSILLTSRSWGCHSFRVLTIILYSADDVVTLIACFRIPGMMEIDGSVGGAEPNTR